MANYASDYTTRCLLHYSGPAGAHKLLYRFGTTVSTATLTSHMTAIVDALAPILYNNCTLDSVDYALVGSSAFSPLFTIGEPGTSGADYSAANTAGGFFLQPIFRGGGGSLFDQEVFYTPMHFNQTMQFNPTDLPVAITTYRDALTTEGCTAIDRTTMVPYGHFNVGINDRETHKLRR